MNPSTNDKAHVTETLRPDICVIGAGSAGLTVAAACAAFRVSVVLIEKARMGGDCLNYGCVPSKALIAASRHAHAIATAGAFGVDAGDAKVNYKRVHRHIHDVIAAIRPNDSQERFTGLGVNVIRAEARFVDRRTVIAGETRIRARRFVIAAGSSPIVPPIPGLDEVDYLTNETIFDLTRLPRRLVIVGGGPIGMELAQAFCRLGSQVTVLEADRALRNDDPELARFVVDRLRAEGVDIRENTTVTGLARHGKTGVRVTACTRTQEQVVDASDLLLAVGRQPNLAPLTLDKAGISNDRNGIRTNARLRTTNRRIYAIGDIAGGYQFTHWAGYQAGLVVRSLLFRFGGKIDRDLVIWATFTDPELAQIGLSEEAARKRHKDVRILRWPYSENDRAQAERQTAGLLKVVVTAKGRILGAGIVGAKASEQAALWALALSQNHTIKALTQSVFPYPTMSELAKRAAVTYYTPQLQNPWINRAIRLLRLFG